MSFSIQCIHIPDEEAVLHVLRGQPGCLRLEMLLLTPKIASICGHICKIVKLTLFEVIVHILFNSTYNLLPIKVSIISPSCTLCYFYFSLEQSLQLGRPAASDNRRSDCWFSTLKYYKWEM